VFPQNISRTISEESSTRYIEATVGGVATLSRNVTEKNQDTPCSDEEFKKTKDFLMKNADFVIVKAEKGNATVILKKVEDDQKNGRPAMRYYSTKLENATSRLNYKPEVMS